MMNDKVYIKVKGLQMSDNDEADNVNEDDDPVEVISVGKYNVVDGKEYIRYDEIYEFENMKGSNLIKISQDCVEITKRGPITAHLSFIVGEKTMTCYGTPFGNIYLGIFTRKLDIKRDEDNIRVSIVYSLELNYETVSECDVEIEISSKGNLDLE